MADGTLVGPARPLPGATKAEGEASKESMICRLSERNQEIGQPDCNAMLTNKKMRNPPVCPGATYGVGGLSACREGKQQGSTKGQIKGKSRWCWWWRGLAAAALTCPLDLPKGTVQKNERLDSSIC